MPIFSLQADAASVRHVQGVREVHACEMNEALCAVAKEAGDFGRSLSTEFVLFSGLMMGFSTFEG